MERPIVLSGIVGRGKTFRVVRRASIKKFFYQNMYRPIAS